MKSWEAELPQVPRRQGIWPYLLCGLLLALAGLYLIFVPGGKPAPAEAMGMGMQAPLSTPTRTFPSGGGGNGGALPPGNGVRELRIGFVGSQTFDVSLQELAERVERYTEGRVKIKGVRDFADGGRKLGELELADRVSRGELEMALSTTSPLSNLNPNFDVLDLPFVLESYPQADRIMSGTVGARLLKGLEKHNLKGLGYLEIGFRIFSCRVPMPRVEDFKGKKVRVMESRTCIRMAQELGAEGVACPPDRVYAMTRDGHIEGADRTYPSYWSSKLYEVQPYITETRHLYSAKVILINKGLFESLPPEDQRALESAAREVEGLHRERQREEERLVRERCRDRGITLFMLEPEERQRFRLLCQPLYVEFQRMRDPKLLDEIQETPR